VPAVTATAAAGPPDAPAAHDGLHGRRRLEALAAILLAVALATLDTAIANTALPTIAAALGVDEASVIWIVNAYQLVVVALLLPLAASGEILGHDRVFLGGTLLFTASSLACGLARSLPVLVAARMLQGLGGAAIMSVNIALIRFVFPANRLGRGAGMNALVVALAFTVGPTVAAAILAVGSWPWLFLVNVPLGVLAAAVGRHALPSTPRERHAFDLRAAALCAGLFGGAVLGFESLSHGGAPGPVAGGWIAAAGCGVLLVRRQAGHPAPMLALDLLRVPTFALSALTAVCAFATQGLGFVALPFLLQGVLGRDAVATGLLMTPWPACVAAMSPLTGRLSDRWPPGLLCGAGLVLLAAGMAAVAGLSPHASTADIAWRTALCGAGFGFFQAPNLKALMGSVPARRSGGASGVVGTARLIGQTTGAGLVALCFRLADSGGAPAPRLALGLGCATALAGASASLLRLLPWRTGPKPAR
jgi:DHA2 family multidrug resistance protein-like MFS transporter